MELMMESATEGLGDSIGCGECEFACGGEAIGAEAMATSSFVQYASKSLKEMFNPKVDILITSFFASDIAESSKL